MSRNTVLADVVVAGTEAASAATTRGGRRSRAAGLAAVVLAGSFLAGCTAGVTAPGGPAATPPPIDASPLPSDEPSEGAGPTPGASPTPSSPTGSDAPLAPTPAPTATPDPTVTPEPVAGDPPEPAPTVTPEPAPSAPPEVAPPAEPEPEPGPLRKGDEGPAVLALQQRLTELGYFMTGVDGQFGAATQQAVWALQKAAGLSRDGLVGPATQAALDAGIRPAPRTTAGRVIEVDLRRQLLLAVDDGVVTRVVNASSGNGETYQALGRTQRAYTPTGDYSLYHQINAMHESTLGLGQMYRPKYFRGGWAVHGSGSIPPWPASHGCVRVSNAAMNWIWDTWGAPLGTRVLVY